MTEEALKDLSTRAKRTVESGASNEAKMVVLAELFIEGQKVMIEWQKGERDKINGFYDKYTAPLYKLIQMMDERTTKTEKIQEDLSKAQNKTTEALNKVVLQIEHMVKCVDHAILESKEEKIRYANQQRDQDKKIDQIEKDLVKLNTNWTIFGKVFGGILAISMFVIALLQLIK